MMKYSKKQIHNKAQAGYMQSNEPKTIRGEEGSRKMTRKSKKQIQTQSQSGGQ